MNISNIRIKLRRFLLKNKKYVMSVFAVIICLMVVVSFLMADSRLDLTLSSSAEAISGDSYVVADEANQTKKITVTAIITENTDIAASEIQSGINAKFEYEGGSVTGTVTVVRRMAAATSPDPADNPATSSENETGNTPATSSENETGNTPATSSENETGNTPATSSENETGNTPSTSSENETGNNPSTSSETETANNSATSSENGSNNANDNTSSTITYQYNVTAVFSVPKNVNSGKYTISYKGGSVSRTIELNQDDTTITSVPEISAVSVTENKDVSMTNGIYYLKNGATAEITVTVDNPEPDYKIMVGNSVISMETGKNSYTISAYNIEKINQTVTVDVKILDKNNNPKGNVFGVKLHRLVEPTISSVTVNGQTVGESGECSVYNVEEAVIVVSVNNPLSGYNVELYGLYSESSNAETKLKNWNIIQSQTSYSTTVNLGETGLKLTAKIVKSSNQIGNEKTIDIKKYATSIESIEIAKSRKVEKSNRFIYYVEDDTANISIKIYNPVSGYKLYLGSDNMATITDDTQYSISYSIPESDNNREKQLKIEIKSGNSSVATSSFYICRDTAPPTLSINKVYSAKKEPKTTSAGNTTYLYSTDSEIKNNWTTQSLIAVQFTISDVGVGFDQYFKLEKSNVKINQKTIEHLKRDDLVYTAYFEIGSETDQLELTVIGLKDALGNKTDEITKKINVGFDRTSPVISDVQISKNGGDFFALSEWYANSSNFFILGDKYKLKFQINDALSGVKKGNASVQVDDQNKGLSYAIDQNVAECSCEITVKSENDVKGIITVVDNAGNQTKMSFAMKFNHAPTFSGVTARSNNNNNTSCAINGNTVTYTVEVTDIDKDVVNVQSFVITDGTNDYSVVNELESNYSSNSDGIITLQYTIPNTNTIHDLAKIKVKSLRLSDGKGNEVSVNDFTGKKNNEITFYAPFDYSDFENASVSVYLKDDKNRNKAIIGDEVCFSFSDSSIKPKQNSRISLDHKVFVANLSMDYSIDGIISDEDSTNKTWITVSNDSVKIPENNSFSDLSYIGYRALYCLYDNAGNSIAVKHVVQGDSSIQYYAPIGESNVVISCSTNNSKVYIKEGDTITNIAVVDKDQKLNENHNLSYRFVMNDFDNLTTDQDNKSVVIPQGKFAKDVNDIEYTVFVSDDAGQSFTIEKLSSGITYYAPIHLENITFTSDGRYNDFARNGSNLTFTARASHKVKASNVNVESFAATTVNDETVDLRFVFNGVNGIANEKMVIPSFDLEDAAGNVYDHKDHIPEIEYDSATPKVSISPKLNGFLNGNFSCTATFADKNLYPEGMKFEYHAKKANATRSAMDTSSFVDKTTIEFKQSLSLSEEDTYKISASVTDKAGNTSADAGMTVTIDKTAPNITSVKITSDTILIFKKGFVISDYVDIEEEFINELICKVSDSTGTVDWDVDKPIETEGKKTISIVVTDMAGNTSSFDFEVYIDATAPDPVVKDTVTGREMEAGKENKFTKELDLSVLLETPQIPNMLQDEFTTLKLLDADGNEVYDFISKDGLKTDYVYNFTDYGKYVLLVEAKDHAIAKDGNDGNVYGPAKYYITFTDGNIFEVIGDNPILMYSLISLLALALIGGGIFAFIILAKRKKDKDKETA